MYLVSVKCEKCDSDLAVSVSKAEAGPMTAVSVAVSPCERCGGKVVKRRKRRSKEEIEADKKEAATGEGGAPAETKGLIPEVEPKKTRGKKKKKKEQTPETFSHVPTDDPPIPPPASPFV